MSQIIFSGKLSPLLARNKDSQFVNIKHYLEYQVKHLDE